mmetsp:Transcript_25965/g.24819  ORF Transcript_25965/g.24819 Transcript_25965/m.24819 type:complete len:372 (-) Transcript_25965:24-1139(-)
MKHLTSFQFTTFQLFLLISLLFPSFVSSSSHETSSNVHLLKSNDPEKAFHTDGRSTYTLCNNEYENFNILSVFNRLSIEVITNKYQFPWHSIKGISSDDSHTNIETAMYQYFGTEEENYSRIKDNFPEGFHQSFLRDILSSCPSPIFSTNRSHCFMTFSPYGDACIQIKTDQSVDMIVNTENKFNIKLPLFLLAGFVLLHLSHIFSKSSIFQYTAGAVIFNLGGILVLSLILSKKVLFGKKDLSYTQLTGMTALLTGSYGATVVWFLKSYFRIICLKYAEFLMIYSITMACFGFIFIRFLRGISERKHFLRISVKWFLRIIGTIFIYSSSASPMVASVYVLLLLMYYIVYVISKWLKEKFIKEVKKIKKND